MSTTVPGTRRASCAPNSFGLGRLFVVRECGACEMCSLIERHGRGTNTGFCEQWGRVVALRDSCVLYVRRFTSLKRVDDADPNIGINLMERIHAGKVRPKATVEGPKILNLGALRRRTAREGKVKSENR